MHPYQWHCNGFSLLSCCSQAVNAQAVVTAETAWMLDFPWYQKEVSFAPFMNSCVEFFPSPPAKPSAELWFTPGIHAGMFENKSLLRSIEVHSALCLGLDGKQPAAHLFALPEGAVLRSQTDPRTGPAK
jgi:hypothetical protein